MNSSRNLPQTADRTPGSHPQAGLDTPRVTGPGGDRNSRRTALEGTLAAAQNEDGGWGYFPGKQSWLEPTAYALLALADQSGGPVFARGWALLRSWELPGGGWRGCAAVNEAHWATSLVVTLHTAIAAHDAACERGVAWLAASIGTEGGLFSRVAHWLRPSIVEFDPTLSGWPWQAGASSWVEPTAHALMALRCALTQANSQEIARRMATGKRMLLDRRCRDGGWNYGNRRVLGADLPSYPETTALALMALGG
ncbi:MAG TPA: prenyltransferase/squalene oxidase repeat-containing protein, partial [Bryobacteraceae bacterium]|nr:prenyltransferase/squalene oxidase repeat-containing protein [Bryobacteraceae bacterium]